MKRKTIIILSILLLVLILLFIWYFNTKEQKYGTFIMPRMEYTTVVVKEIDPDFILADVHMALHNPLPIGFAIDSLQYDFFIEGTKIFSGSYPQNIDFNGNDTNGIMLPIKLHLQELKAALKGIENQDSADYRIEGTYYAEFPLTDEKQMSFNLNKRLPAYKTPDIKIVEWDYELSVSESDLHFVVEVNNHNVFPIEIDNLEYAVTLGKDEMVLNGAKAKVISIPKQGKDAFILPITIGHGEVFDALGELLKKGKNLEYSFRSEFNLVSDKNFLKNSPIKLLARGTLGELRSASGKK